MKSKADEIAVANGCWFDVAAAEKAREFFRRFLKHTTDEFAGKPFELLAWQYEEVVSRIWGWKRADGARRFTKGFVSTAKKNGKTELFAGLAIYLLLTNGPGTEIYSAASDRNQASHVYKAASGMVSQSPELSRVINFRDSTKTLLGQGRSLYRALAADAHRAEGYNASVILADELHAWPGRELYDALNYAGSARTNPLFLIITTAGDDLETICGEEYARAKRWLAGDYVDDSYFAFIAESDPADDWTSEETWKKANPSFGTTINVAKFRSDFLEAKESPAKEASFRRYKLNQWVSVADTWLNMEKWDLCPKVIDFDVLKGRPCYAGLDLSAVNDTTALALVFPVDHGAIVIPRFYLPTNNITTLEKQHRVPYRAWAKGGHLTLTQGNVVDYAYIRREMNALAGEFDIKKLIIDRKFQGLQLESQLMEDGFDVMPAGQGWLSQDIPLREIEKFVQAGTLNHGGNPILRWHASNTVVDIDRANNISLNKRKSRSKIDGIAALAMGVFAMMREGPRQVQSYYTKNPELIVLG